MHSIANRLLCAGVFIFGITLLNAAINQQKISSFLSDNHEEQVYVIDCMFGIIPNVPASWVCQSEKFKKMLRNNEVENNTFDITVTHDIMSIVLDYMRICAENDSEKTEILEKIIKNKFIQEIKSTKIPHENIHDVFLAIRYLNIQKICRLICLEHYWNEDPIIKKHSAYMLDVIKVAKKCCLVGNKLPLFIMLKDSNDETVDAQVTKLVNEAINFFTKKCFFDDSCFALCKKFGVLPDDAPEVGQKRKWCAYVKKLIAEKRYDHLQASLNCLCRCKHTGSLSQSVHQTIVQTVEKSYKTKM